MFSSSKLFNLFIIFISTSILLCSIAAVEYTHKNYTNNLEQETQQNITAYSGLLRSQIEGGLNYEVFISDTLATLVTFAPDVTINRWDAIGEKLNQKAAHIKNIGLAPNDVLAYVYPIEGNEGAIGLDFRENPQQWKSVLKARESKTMYIQGPINLVQRGKGLIARMPIFTDPPQNQIYWGHASVVIDVDELLLGAGLNTLPGHLQIAIKTLDETTNNDNVFYGEPHIFDNPMVLEEVNIFENRWAIAITPKPITMNENTLQWYTYHAVRIGGYLITVLLLVSFIVILKSYQIAKRSSLHDALTHLPNRRFALNILNQLKDSKFTIINIDLDKFKLINDQFGHGVGDKYLVEVAKRLSRPLRGSDTVARLGGDEFLVILPRIEDNSSIETVLNKIKLSCESEPFIYGKLTLDIRLSVGCASFPEDADSIDELMHKADIAMYNDKQAKRALHYA